MPFMYLNIQNPVVAHAELNLMVSRVMPRKALPWAGRSEESLGKVRMVAWLDWEKLDGLSENG